MVRRVLNPCFKPETLIKKCMQNRDVVVKGAAKLSYILHENGESIAFNAVASHHVLLYTLNVKTLTYHDDSSTVAH